MGVFDQLISIYSFSYYSGLLLTVALFGIVAAATAWQRRRVPGARYLALMELAGAIWASAIIFETAATTAQLKFIWMVLAYPGMSTVPVFFLLFVLEFTRRGHVLSPTVIFLLFAVPIVLVVAAVTNEWHHLLWQSITVNPTTHQGVYVYGPLLIILLLLVYATVSTGLFILFRSRDDALNRAGPLTLPESVLRDAKRPEVSTGGERTQRASSRQVWLLIALTFVTLLSVTLYVAGVNPVPGEDWSPMGFGISGVCLVWAMLSGRIFNLLPVARAQLVDSMSDGIIVTDLNDEIVDVNPAATHLLNVARHTVIGMPVDEMMARWPGLDKRAGGLLTVQTTSAQGAVENSYIDVSIAPVLDRRRHQIGHMLVLRDITARRKTEHDLHREHEFTRVLLDNLVDGVIGCDAEGMLVLFNHTAREWFGQDVSRISPERWRAAGEEPLVVPSPSQDTLYAEDGVTPLTIVQEPLYRAFHGERFSEVGMSIHTHDQPTRYVKASGGPFYDVSGTRLGAVVTMEDVTATKRATEALLYEQYLMRVLLDNVPDIIYFKDTASRFIRVNKAVAARFGLSDSAEAIGKTLFDLVMPNTAQRAQDDEEQVMRTGESIIAKEETLEREGQPVAWVSTTKMPLRDQGGNIIGTVGISHDITERKWVEDNLRYVSVHDALTGLYNRAYFDQTCRTLTQETDFPLSTVIIDIDGMKAVNDTYGHAAGDELLRRAAVVLRSAFRGDDIVARIGGDEFAVLLPHTDSESATAVVERLKHKLMEHNALYAGAVLNLSTGVATAHVPEDLTATLFSADEKMYRNKTRRRNKAQGVAGR